MKCNNTAQKTVIFSPRPVRSKELKGRDYTCMDPAEVPSLMALLSSDPEITDLVILPGAPWSLAHILAAAKHLQGRGKTYLVGGAVPELQKELPLVSRVDTLDGLSSAIEAAQAANTKKPAGRGKGMHHAISSPPNKEAPAPAELLWRPIQPMRIPDDVVYYIAVAGSQERIGCTTQAIGLWHYCKALGFDPAIVAGPGPTAAMAKLMDAAEIPGGWNIDGIPFVQDAAQAYDCYIRDLGPLGSCDRDAFFGADWSLLVAGAKPWELAATVEAAAILRPRAYASVLLSYATEADRRELEEIFDGRGVMAAPWLPRPWKPTTGALAPYDKLLRPVLTRYLRERAYCRERTF